MEEAPFPLRKCVCVCGCPAGLWDDVMMCVGDMCM